VPLSPSRYKVEFTAGQALHDKLQQLRDLLRHRVPDGDLAAIVELAVDQLVDKTMKQRFAQTQAPKKPRAIQRRARSRRRSSRYIPRAVVREVYERDGGRCTFVSADGKRCSERGFLELHHHDVPYGKGGAATVDNLRLACRVHNGLFAERDYGRRYMRKKLQARVSSVVLERHQV
jgi:5-methylcytosine-specific restriction endonuclease McrA